MFGLALVSCLSVTCTSSHDVAPAIEGAQAYTAAGSGSVPVRAGSAPPTTPTTTTPHGSPQVPRGGDPDDYVFSQTALRNYDVEVDPEEWARINREAYLEQYIHGQLRFEGKTYEVGVRFKGFRGSLYNCFDFDENGVATRRTCPRLPIKLSFDEYDEGGRFFGLRKLNFHVMRNDPSLMRERVAYHIFRSFGVPAPRAVHATLSINGEPLGLFALVEQVDGRFARHAFAEGGEGNIYKERWPMLSSDADYFRSGLEANKKEGNVSAMERFARALEGADADNIESILREHTNLDELMRYLAVDRAINHWDGPLAFRCRAPADVPPLPPVVEAAQRPALGWEVCQNKNYYWYEETQSGRLWLVPWDMDVTLNSFSQFPDWNTEPNTCEIRQQGRPPRCDKLINLFATTLRPAYEAAGRELLEGPLRSELLTPLIDSWYAQIAPHTDPFSIGVGALLLQSEIGNRIRAFTTEVIHNKPEPEPEPD